DGLNDTFIVKGIRIEDFQIQIFNQWGEKVFENNNANLGWDGKFRGQLSSMGVYTYYIKSIGMDGENISVSGTLHLIR
ncbi:MAG: T9SS type B sorting domain-containing protein, partial [Bacteroidetes bacterium]|nr:T9SS type B sorting domain-containing protein [Bacteroidota bacterium]